MTVGSGDGLASGFLFVAFAFQVMIHASAVRSETSDPLPITIPTVPTMESYIKGYRHSQVCQHCHDKEDHRLITDSSSRQHNSNQPNENIDITATYTDASGALQLFKVKSKDLSSSWVWRDSIDENFAWPKGGLEQEGSTGQAVRGFQEGHRPSVNQDLSSSPVDPVKLQRQLLRRRRKEMRTAALIQLNRDAELQMETAAIERSRRFNTTVRGRYSIWRREHQDPRSDSTLKLMKDQIIMAKVYASIARSKKKNDLFDSLMKHIKESQRAIGEANSDTELHPRSLERAKAMGHILSMSKDMLYDCNTVARKLRAMLQSTEESITALKKKSTFLTQHAAKTIPRPLHCLPLQLTADYFLHDHRGRELADKEKLEDPSLYHYAIFSDNVLATSVVVNSTIIHAKEPEKHVFHIVTDRLNFAAMKMWFILHPPSNATVNVENIDDFKWLNSSYCSVLRQLESSRLREYYFKANHPSTLSAGDENLKYRNPKYLSMLNHLRFYMPEVYPKLDKILFLDDDVVVQKDLTPLWSIDMNGMVNGAVETCKESFHRFETYLNFSNPMISKNFDPQACGWAFGMNIFDLKEWKKRNITGIYHHWQDLNEDRKLWKLGSLPPGLITFYNLTYVLDRSWHVLGLGYDPAISSLEIEKAAVIHYNGNYKPWLDLAMSRYKSYWTKFVKYDNPYLRLCHIDQW